VWGGCPPPHRERGLGRGYEKKFPGMGGRGPGLSPGRQRIFGIFDAQNTSGRENSVTLLNNVQSPKSDIFV